MTGRSRTGARLTALVSASLLALATGCGDGGGAAGGGTLVGLVTKTDTNPFFVKMKEGAQKAAGSTGATVQSFAGKQDGDNQSQVDAIENLIGAGAKGILLTPNDSKAIVPSVDKARQAGLLVIALDTQLEPADAADATFATDNYQAGCSSGSGPRRSSRRRASRRRSRCWTSTPTRSPWTCSVTRASWRASAST